jgi:protein phosphatase 1 regulatory subunit 7
LYVAANRVTRIEALDALAPGLRVLELGSNAIPALEGLGKAGALTALWLGRNRISALPPPALTGLTSLRVLALPSNRLTSMAGLGCGATPALEELYLSHNGVARIEGLAPLRRLRVLDLASNALADVAGLGDAPALTDLWLNDNAIGSLGSLATALRAGQAGGSVTCAYLAGNPAVDALIAAGKKNNAEEGASGSGPRRARPSGLALGYARAARAMMPALVELDGDDVAPVLARAGEVERG